MLQAQIKNFSYKKYLKENLLEFNFKNINDLPSKSIVNFNDKVFAISKWVSPKRTRSYPYARVYDTFDCGVSKIVTIIPIIKDEGMNGDMDYLQWDTVSLMSLLNIYVILSFYDEAHLHNKIENKITRQNFNNKYIAKQLESLSNYHQSALHWNLNQLNNENLFRLTDLAKESYMKISKNLNCKLHNFNNIDNFTKKYCKIENLLCNFQEQKHKRRKIERF